VDPLFWILSGVVAGCLIGIIILWQLESRAEKQLAAQRQAEGDSSASLPVVDPLAELERLATRPIPAAALPASGLKPTRPPPGIGSVAGEQPPALAGVDMRDHPPTPVPARAERPPVVSLMPREQQPAAQPTPPALEEMPTEKLPGTLVSASALEELPTGKLPSLVQPPQPANQPAPASVPPAAEMAPEPPLAPESQEPMAGPATAQEMDPAAPGRARLHLAELARERGYLGHTLEANQSKLEELERGLLLPDSEEALAISVLRDEIARQRQRLAEISALEERYRQVVAGWSEQTNEQAQQPDLRAPKAFSARRLSRPRVAQAQAEPPEALSPPSPPG
jgi:hypothetical protein